MLCVQQFDARSHAREYADNSGPYRGGNSSYYGHRTNTIDYGHRGMKTSDDDPGKMDPWSREPFTEQRHYSSGRHHTADKPKGTPPGIEADQPSKVVAVEKAMEMAQRTREIISKLGGLKQMSQQSETSLSFTDTSVQPSNAGFSSTETQPSETNAVTAKAPTDLAAINKIRQNTSLVQYAFNLPVEPERRNESGSSLPSHDVKSSWTDAQHKYGSTFERPVPDHSHEGANYAVTSVTANASYEDKAAVYSQPSAWNVAPKVAQEPAKTKTDSCDPTIANILKSIGFNFELSNMMQDKARKESTSSVGQNSSTESNTNKVPALYEERANRYRAEQMRQYETHKPDNEESLQLCGSADKSSLNLLQHSYDDKPFAEDIFKESPAVDFKLKFKASDTNASQKSSPLYEDFSDSDDDFTATAQMDAMVESKSNVGLVSQKVPNMSAFGNEGTLQQMTASKTADDLDWELSTEVFIRKLQQPRQAPAQAQRTVTVVPKSEPAGHSVAVPPVQSEHVDGDALETQSDNFKLAKTFVPLEELKTIRKTIIVSESPVKTESGTSKSDSSSKSVKSSYSTNSTNREKTPKFQQRSEGTSKSAEKASIDSSRKKKRSDSDERENIPTTGSKVTKPDTKERQKRIEALQRELENLKRQQNILMRRRKREKDAHKDPFLTENNKLQEEICNQIDKLKEALDSSRSQTSDQVCESVSTVFRGFMVTASC